MWSGFGSVGPWNAHFPHPCQYAGSTHLCVFQGNQQPGYCRGHAVIFDQDYKIVKTIGTGADEVPADQHEFRLLDGGKTALLTAYGQKTWDLSSIGIKTELGWIQDSIFQEVDVATGSVLFSWSASDHVNIHDGYVKLKGSDISGDGLTPHSAWDFLYVKLFRCLASKSNTDIRYSHINSIDKSVMTGNYLISARHFSSIFYIDHKDGNIIWKLEAGGDSDFTCLDFNFSFQHDARIRDENSTHMLISIFDNASNQFNSTAPFSSGKLISIDYATRIATLSGPITKGPNEIRSNSQGNTQILENGNIFHGWGSWPVFSEHAPDGSIIWSANIGPGEGIVMNYRASVGDWYSIPSDTSPSVYSFSKDSDALCVFYVSWNGCTEVASWRFYGSHDKVQRFQKLGTTKKVGFETKYTSDTHYAYVIAEAVLANGTGIRNSSAVRTFMPGAELSSSCLDSHCPSHAMNDYDG